MKCKKKQVSIKLQDTSGGLDLIIIILGKNIDVFCVHCGKSNICPFPCPSCPDVLFCSLRCLDQAQKSYHKYECQMRLYAILKYIAGNSADSMSVGKMLGLRIATLYGATQGNLKIFGHDVFLVGFKHRGLSHST